VEHPVGDEREIVDASVGADNFDRVQVGLVGAVGHHADVGAQGSVQRESSLDSLDLATRRHRFFVNLLKKVKIIKSEILFKIPTLKIFTHN
jgi:hypothetical protein